MKKAICILCLILCFGLAACAGKGETPVATPPPETSPETEPEVPPKTPAPETEPGGEQAEQKSKEDMLKQMQTAITPIVDCTFSRYLIDFRAEAFRLTLNNYDNPDYELLLQSQKEINKLIDAVLACEVPQGYSLQESWETLCATCITIGSVVENSVDAVYDHDFSTVDSDAQYYANSNERTDAIQLQNQIFRILRQIELEKPGKAEAPVSPEPTATSEPPPAIPEAPQASPEQIPAELPYLEQISDADQAIYSGPGYDYGYVTTVKLAGIYTIVEESCDDEGSLWGKLKSGAGWVNLTEIRTPQPQQPISVNYADDVILPTQGYYEFSEEEFGGPVRMAITANEVLTDLSFSLTEFGENGYEIGETIYRLPVLLPEDALVANVSFWGDFTAYGISFTNAAGKVQHFRVHMSLRDGSLELAEFKP